MIAWCSLLLIPPLVLLILATWRQYLETQRDAQASDIAISGIVLPLLASAGFLGLLWDREGVLGAPGALVVGSGPMVFGLITGWLLVRSPRACGGGWPSGGVIMSVGGLLLIMMATAGRVSHTVGLIACTIGMVLIWLTSLRSRGASAPANAAARREQPLSLTLALAGSLLLAFCTRLAPIDWMPLVLALLILEVLMMLYILMASRGPEVVFEGAGWFAVLLPCLGLGLLGQDRLAMLIRGNDLPGLPPVVPTLRSTEGLMVPGLVIVLSVLFWFLAGSVPSSWRRTMGLCLLVAVVLALLQLRFGLMG
ncbi:MAG: hypothetical protein CMJ40_07350 [Phycisphaerae bacterium]|nr:hypothetical protein [Phycisphaerae bacterium]